MALDKKTTALFKLMERFLIEKEIRPYDETILVEFGCSSKTLERYLKEIESLYDHIITIKESRKKIWKLVSVSDIFEEFIKNSQDLSQLFLMAQGFDSSIFQELEKGTLSKIAKNDEQVFLFKNFIMEELQSTKTKEIFKNLKVATKNHEYRDIYYHYNKEIVYKNIKPLKLIFMDNNWYIAFLNEENKFLFSRLSFIEKIKKRASQNTYQKKDIKPYLDFLKNVQNAMTLYDVKAKVATVKATPHIAKYFEKNMKKFLPSQTFKEKLPDGSILFTLNYTQELEILPFIQKWLPDLVIVAPKELKEAYVEKLKTTLGHYDAIS
ncbi:MAG: Transcriptional regulator, putative [uncultured Sulfurovum sp.]|uniref:Transcriptional regulator, putative n=1 Tax=uncultured Sulfurovum sp. TaxID=269237 RepID=A0A6S6TQI1_9BACT|nr:MAG: Transcriptional regulator, putative [uncultured Sulfurovum sp.]